MHKTAQYIKQIAIIASEAHKNGHYQHKISRILQKNQAKRAVRKEKYGKMIEIRGKSAHQEYAIKFKIQKVRETTKKS